MYTHKKNIITRGKPLEQTKKALVMLHGRGATAESILSLGEHLQTADFTLFAPQATNNSWYPYSFMAPAEKNQPALDTALEVIDETIKHIQGQGVASQNIYLLGFSQGACLASEYATRNAQHFGGLLLFTGGLVGQEVDTSKYQGNFEGTPVFISTGDPDPHVPVSRVEETVKIMEGKGAVVTKKIYKGRPHTILQEELTLANQILSRPTGA
ncbi:phospholipase/carboxylesterase [Pontibacter ummariensis]|uniref:Phospholipase/carboxylesterase n=1 Tax=Pontibacter ummariensis TaxID=1610492 RepID=A0A239GN51_9BACT|nr:alpha/beta hydrolase [Pontibacter ummariensis]PRY11340.1 phospholipase/carboxylesterase [Pontibacter ummariensis]SNS70242.1 phospholipase/carboxylesterase [Pontibacter ummariensis]